MLQLSQLSDQLTTSNYRRLTIDYWLSTIARTFNAKIRSFGYDSRNLDNINLKTIHIIHIRSLWQEKSWDGNDDKRIMLWRLINVQTIEWQSKTNNKVWVWLGLIISVSTESTICSRQSTNVEYILWHVALQLSREHNRKQNTNHASTNYAQTIVSQTAKLDVNYVLGV